MHDSYLTCLAFFAFLGYNIFGDNKNCDLDELVKHALKALSGCVSGDKELDVQGATVAIVGKVSGTWLSGITRSREVFKVLVYRGCTVNAEGEVQYDFRAHVPAGDFDVHVICGELLLTSLRDHSEDPRSMTDRYSGQQNADDSQ